MNNLEATTKTKDISDIIEKVKDNLEKAQTAQVTQYDKHY